MNHKKLTVGALLTLCAAACSTISPYSQRSYELTTATKAEAISVLDKASGRYADNAAQVDALRLNVEKAYEYSRGIPRNDVTVGMWQIIKGYQFDPTKREWIAADNGNLYSTLDLWKSKGHLSDAMVVEKKRQIASSFDQIIELESGKPKLAQ